MQAEDRLPLSARDYLILLILTRGACHGYGILKGAERHGGEETRLDPANLYRALRKLDRDGLVEVAEEAAAEEAEGPPRRVYALTPEGEAVVRAESARLARLTDTARAWRLIPDSASGG